MAKFNQSSTGIKTVNKAGGSAFKESHELELVSLVLTSFNENKFYESASDQNERLVQLIEKTDKEFIGKLALYARHEFNMRSVSHVLMAELARLHKGEKNTIKDVFLRPDDMTEVVAYYGNKHGKPIPNSIKKAIREKLTEFNAYQLGKYKEANSEVKLVDLFNLVHPKPLNNEQAKTWKDLMEGKLSSDTWEVALSTSADDEERKTEWERLIMEGKLGYMAMIRNLRNFTKYGISDNAKKKVCEFISNEDNVKKSRQLPFRFWSAYKNAEETCYKDSVSFALDHAINNIPKFDGRTAVLIDVSGSMSSNLSGKSEVSYVDIARLFGVSFFKANPNNCDVYGFDSQLYGYTLSSRTPVIDLIYSIHNNGGSTDLWLAFAYFAKEKKNYDRVIIFSDMQAWSSDYGARSVNQYYNQWKQAIDNSPKIYSVDLAGYGTHQFPEKDVLFVSGWSERIFDLMKYAEQDKNILVNTIRNYEIPKKKAYQSTDNGEEA